jgi:hypothetical protein
VICLNKNLRQRKIPGHKKTSTRGERFLQMPRKISDVDIFAAPGAAWLCGTTGPTRPRRGSAETWGLLSTLVLHNNALTINHGYKLKNGNFTQILSLLSDF